MTDDGECALAHCACFWSLLDICAMTDNTHSCARIKTPKVLERPKFKNNFFLRHSCQKLPFFMFFDGHFFSSLLCHNFGPGTDRQPEPLREKKPPSGSKKWLGKAFFLRPCGSQSLLAFSLAHPLSPAVSMGPLQGPHNLKIPQKHEMLLLRGRITSRHYKRQPEARHPSRKHHPNTGPKRQQMRLSEPMHSRERRNATTETASCSS